MSPELLIATEMPAPPQLAAACIPVEQIRPGLAEILESIENAVRVDRSRVTTIQLVRARLQLQSMISGLPE